MIDIKGMDKAEVLSALHGASKAQGMGFLFDRGGMSVEECRKEIADRTSDGMAFGGALYFDYLRGRVMKVDLSGDELDPRLFDRDVGPGAAERAIAALRERTPA